MSNHKNDDSIQPDADSDDPTEGNRPAEGARQGTPGEVFGGNFTGSDAAGDFLGLDVDMDEMYAAGSEEEGLDQEKPGLELRDPSPTGSETEPTAEVPAEDGSFTNPPAAWADDDHLDVEELDDYEDDEEYEDESYVDATAGSGGRRIALIAVPFVLGVVAVAGVVLVPRMFEPEPGSTEVATRTTPGPNGTNQPTETNTEMPEVDPTGEIDTTSLVDNGAPFEPGSEPEVLPEIDIELETATDFELPIVVERTEPVPVLPGLDELIGSLVSDDLEPGVKGGEVPFDTSLGQGALSNSTIGANVDPAAPWASSSDNQWDVIWNGEVVPMEAIASAQQVLTPRVGGVRVHMRSGEVFDGKLYALGQNRVWIDARPGRMGLDGLRVTKIDRLDRAATERSNGARATKGERVKLRVPGGHLFGHILADDGAGTLTVQTDAGGRVTVIAAEVEPVGRSRVRILE